MSRLDCIIIIPPLFPIRVSIRKTFAQFLRNETQNFSFVADQFCAKKTAICVIIRKSNFAQNCPIPLFRNSSFAQFCNFVIIICLYFLELKGFSPNLNSGKIWFWNVLLLVTSTYLTNAS